MSKLAPSILSADFAKLGEEVTIIEEAGAHLIHVDVMDGHFVPNISYGAAVMKSLCGKTALNFDVHLMIENADQYIGEFATEQTRYITVHQEACPHLHRTVQYIRDCGALPGVALNPATPINVLEEILPLVDLVLIMSVNPGFGGQKLIPSALKKIAALAQIRNQNNLDFQIEIDGGINLQNVKDAVNSGTDIIVAGSSVFSAPHIKDRVKEFLLKL